MAFEFYEVKSLEECVFQALGAASVCWESIEEAGEFNSTRAKEIGDALLEKIYALGCFWDCDHCRDGNDEWDEWD